VTANYTRHPFAKKITGRSVVKIKQDETAGRRVMSPAFERTAEDAFTTLHLNFSHAGPQWFHQEVPITHFYTHKQKT